MKPTFVLCLALLAPSTLLAQGDAEVLMEQAAEEGAAVDLRKPTPPAVSPASGFTVDEALAAATFWRDEGRWSLAEEALLAARGLAPSPAITLQLAEVAIGQERPHAARWILRDLDTPEADALRAQLPEAPKQKGLAAAFELRKAGDPDAAEYVLNRGGARTGAALMEHAYIASAQGRVRRADAYLAQVAAGSDDTLAVQAYREREVLPRSMAAEVFAEALEARKSKQFDRAEQLLEALLPVEDPQRVNLELAWNAAAAGVTDVARERLALAAAGPDAALAETARTQLAAMPDPTATRVLERARAERSKANELKASSDTHAEGLAGLEDAVASFEEARELGANPQIVDIEIGYTLLDLNRPEAAAVRLRAAAAGSDPTLARQAEELLGTVDQRVAAQYAAQARIYRDEEKYDLAITSLENAEQRGLDPCRLELERGYLEAEQNHPAKARRHFRTAAECGDEDVAELARGELKSRYKLFWGDFYGELYGWHRFAPEQYTNTNLVPTLRLRGYIHPIPKLDLDPYIFARFSRDVGSRANGPNGLPLILADNTVMVGVGVLFRFWKRRVGIYAQIGPAFNLLDDGRDRVSLDARVAAFFAVSAPTCNPAPQMTRPGARLTLEPCGEVYAEAVWVSRFDNNIFTMGRGRAALTYLVTGPVAWQPFAEVRVLKDINNDYWNNLIDAGGGHRWRLLKPFGLDLMLGIHGGAYFGLENHDPVPSPPTYAELRLQAFTYVAF